MSLAELFGTQNNLSFAQECARAILVFFFGLALMRFSGRRIFAKWSALDVIVSVVVGSNLSRTLTGSAPLWGTLAASALFVALHWLLAHLVAGFPGMARLLEGAPTPIGEKGNIDEVALLRHGLSREDIAVALRQKGLTSVAQTRLLVIEPNGKLSVFPKD